MASASGVPSDIGLSAAGDWAREIRRATVAQMGHGTGARGVIHLVRDAKSQPIVRLGSKIRNCPWSTVHNRRDNARHDNERPRTLMCRIIQFDGRLAVPRGRRRRRQYLSISKTKYRDLDTRGLFRMALLAIWLAIRGPGCWLCPVRSDWLFDFDRSQVRMAGKTAR